MQGEGTLVTEVVDNKRIFPLAGKKYQIYTVQDSVPPTQFGVQPIQSYTPLPSTVQFGRIVANVITSLSNSYFKMLPKQKNGESIVQKWAGYLNLQQNKALVSDCFWYALCKYFHATKYTYSEQQLQKRISNNYIGLFLSLQDKKQSKVFFKQYFNTLTQSVFYSFFYAFPKSRAKFDNRLKQQLLLMFSKMMTGIEISNRKSYFEKWSLDLGTGNILARRGKKDLSEVGGVVEGAEKKRETLALRYSPIVDLYLKTHKYKTRNYVSEFKMKYTQADKREHVKEEKFRAYVDEAKKILQWSHAQKEDQDAKKILLDSEIKALKRETLNHHKRLDRRKAEELERGAHEYANYLVSMLNAGITMTSLGVVRKNTT